jgi:CMP-N-acetylneuraminic acid synthetase
VGLTVFLPCRRGSERVADKNTRPFGELEHGLIELKLRQLEESRLVDSVVVSTDDPWIYANATRYEYTRRNKTRRLVLKASTHWRDPALCESTTSTDDLIPHAVELIPDGEILWTHCTSPFITAEIYDEMIRAYYEPGDHDSLMTVQRVRGFYWLDGAPINHSGWPRTQTIPPMDKATSGGFIAPADIYRAGDRIGKRPKLFEVNTVAGMDIDTPDDFALAEHLYMTGYA